MYDNTIPGCQQATNSTRQLKIGVLGTSNGAHAVAADLLKSGYPIRWSCLNDYENENWQHLCDNKKLKWTRGFPETVDSGECDLDNVVTNEIDAVIEQSDILFIIAPAYRHEAYLEKLINFSLKDKLLVFMPGRYASLRLKKLLKHAGKPDQVTVAEVSCLLYSSKIKSPGHVNIKSMKSLLYCGVMPANKSTDTMDLLQQIYPQFKTVKNILDSNLLDPCTFQHPVTTIFNASRIAHHGNEDCSFYNISESVGRILDLVDNEKANLQNKLGCTQGNTAYILGNYYNLNIDIAKANSFQAISNVPWYTVHKLPLNLEFRYISEDIPFGIVPLLALGKLANINCHYLNIVVDLCSQLNHADYVNSGYTLDKLGIEQLSIEEISQYLECGVLENVMIT